VVVTCLIVASSSCIDPPKRPQESTPRGGTLKAILAPLPDPFTLDPQRDYAAEPWGFFRCCLLRTLLSYPGLPTARGGAELKPDLAASPPDVSSDGLTWTFRIKRGLRYGPPFTNTEILASDIVRALERVARVGGDAYPFYYAVIEGFPEVVSGKAESISGLEAPDDHTLVIHLTQPTGDLGYRLALPAAAPIPPVSSGAALGSAEGHEEYGRFLVASGPYTIEGSDELDFSLSPEEQPPLSGFDPGISLTLVRNPSWRARTDPLRPAYPDRIEVSFLDSQREAAEQVARGDADVVLGLGPPPQVPNDIIEQYRNDPSLSKRIVIGPRDLIVYATMNLAVPPFDDIHVRKAVNLAIDKAEFLDIHGGRAIGKVTGHVILNSLENNLLLNYDPYATPASAGNLDSARQEMALSRYDRDGDGLCDDPVCRNVLAVAAKLEGGVGRKEGEAFASDLKALGISLDLRVLDFGPFFTRLSDPRRHVALGINAGWIKDFPAAGSFVLPLFSRNGLGVSACCNYSLVGATSEELRSWGYKVTSVPSVEEKVSDCVPLIGGEQVRCYAELDQQIMEQIVPWVPLLVENHVYIVSRRVASTSFDQFATQPAVDRTALSAGRS
jgi:peptide/nickel transport system substrate-binding protein